MRAPTANVPATSRPIASGQSIRLEAPPSVPDLGRKQSALRQLLRDMGPVLVAYSGGVDSTYLLAEAAAELGEKALGVIAKSPSLPKSELEAALVVAASRGIAVRVIETRELEREEYRRNAPDRCYHCKAELFESLEVIASTEGWASIAYGAVTDDLGDIRPGMAAAERFRVRAPLLEAGMGKVEVRTLAREIGLPVWDKPQSACLASRIPHGSRVTEAKLLQVERGEAWLKGALGLRVVRLRHEGERARLEVGPDEIARLASPDTMARTSLKLNSLGFKQVVVDPRGYRRPDPTPAMQEEPGDAESR